VTTPISQVRFNGNVIDRTIADEDLTTTNNGSILVQSLDGDIVVKPGSRVSLEFEQMVVGTYCCKPFILERYVPKRMRRD
jgi:hypothetical protein